MIPNNRPLILIIMRPNGGMFGENDYTNAVHSGPSSFRALLVQSEVAYDVEDRNRRKEHQRVRSTKATPLDISSGRYRLAVDLHVRTHDPRTSLRLVSSVLSVSWSTHYCDDVVPWNTMGLVPWCGVKDLLTVDEAVPS